ncbi:4'-phosphopantetheinyl transferase family protein [Dyadobacter aurulentus]|uniref:4'-phosphopantetheinyl transferase family protein n=1 Tax=Dyadobacter sp. UC 10 TaxID=2605428 RepID=UPI0011F359A4|nr:4'-phosphopantetheinyl transferase superfamily protein [Dyadobacter sp. UC 10]KAA0988972.1 4'-phosphopantetheinyl transferase superfamily protein [Dyadobacter sp. UC 10]
MGICYIKTISAGAQLGMWRMAESWQELKIHVNLPAEEFQALDLIEKDRRKTEWLSCRILLENMTGNPPVIRHDTNRKPYLPGTDYQLSMSHSGDYAAVYLNKSKSVGIDIQQMKPSISKGIDYFLNAEEQEWIDIHDNLLLHLLWSAKESAFKYAGNADLNLKKHLTIKRFKSNQNGQFEVFILNQGKAEKLEIAYDTFDDYVLTWTL